MQKTAYELLRSLVGSEMCIRDRFYKADKTRGANAGKMGLGLAICKALVVAQGGDCLLYTSDAADDLLCVVLGGRPIIKKKTKKIFL